MKCNSDTNYFLFLALPAELIVYNRPEALWLCVC